MTLTAGDSILYRSPHLVAPCTTTAWLLIWCRKTTNGLELFGVAGAESTAAAEILSIFKLLKIGSTLSNLFRGEKSN